MQYVANASEAKNSFLLSDPGSLRIWCFSTLESAGEQC